MIWRFQLNKQNLNNLNLSIFFLSLWRLRHLAVRGTTISNKSLKPILTIFPALKSLSIGSFEIDSEGFINLTTQGLSYPCLERLTLCYGCIELTSFCSSLSRLFPKLKFLDVLEIPLFDVNEDFYQRLSNAVNIFLKNPPIRQIWLK